ncbi:MAG: CidA/LrgA family protein [Holophaga sp.]|nr:CidA/LrgA family protein [Holophaga sp.]
MQAGILIGAWWLCDRLTRALDLPLPGGIIALGVLLCLLLSGRVRLGLVRRGAAGLLDHMVLFFVPAVMALLNHPELLGMVGLKILVVIAFSTLAVMVGTALVVDVCFRWRADHVA